MTRDARAAARLPASTALKNAAISASHAVWRSSADVHSAVASVTASTGTGYLRRASSDMPPAITSR